MGTIKKFWKYFLLFIVAFFLIGFLTNLVMKDNYHDVSNYEIKTVSPEIKVEEFKVEYSHGYIKGSVTNNTGKHLQLKYLRIDLYNKEGKYAGTEYKELKYFNVNETIKFDLNFRYREIEKATLSIVDKKEEVKTNFIDGIKNI